jgi:hypothetical protein
MAQDVKELSTEQLRKKIRAARIVLSICWGAIIIAVVISLFFGKSAAIGAGSVGIIGLGVATLAMWMGMKKAKEELALRGDNRDS